jgi:glycosyltransferase involved in cell wall biosynthesis
MRVGVLANLVPFKGHEDFLLMARRLLDRGHMCEFWIVGEDRERSGYEGHLRRFAGSLGLNGQVKFLGFRADVAEILWQLDILVSSSHYEPFGRTLIEAMACELPVVATKVGGIPEVVADGETGILVPPREPEALADGVGRLLGDARLRGEMGRAGRARVEALFSSTAHAAQVLTVYQKLLCRN